MAESTEPDSQPTCVGIGLIRRGESYLIRQRPAQTVYAGYWEFPGGKCEPGETPAETTARECLEETGLVVKVGRLRRVIEHRYAHFTSSIANPPTPLPSQLPPRVAAGSRPPSCQACAFLKPTRRYWPN